MSYAPNHATIQLHLRFEHERKTPGVINLYFDIDGVILGQNPDTHEPIQAAHAKMFLDFIAKRFNCHILAPQSRNGVLEQALRHCRKYCDKDVMARLSQCTAARYDSLKVAALRGDFIWIDDSPTATELAWLQDRGLINRFLLVDTRKNPDDLQRAHAILKRLSEADAVT